MKALVHLSFETGPAKGQRFTVPEPGFRIGRGARNDLTIEDATLSREQCRFFFRAGKLWVVDLKSANGTALNGQPIDSAALEKGDHVVLGDTSIRILAATQKPPPSFAEKRRAAHAASSSAEVTTSSNLFHNVAWTLLIVWWAFLAFSLCLPPPVTTPEPPTVIIEPPPTEVEDPAVDVEATIAPSLAPAAEIDQAAAERAAGDAESIRSIQGAVSRRLILEDYPSAMAMVQAHLESPHTTETQAALTELAQYVATVQALNGRVAEALGAQAGRRITLRAAGTNVPFRVLAVSGSKLRGVLLAGEGDKETSVEIAKLHPADRLHWLGDAQSPEANALRAVLESKSGNPQRALELSKSAGLLAESLQLVLNDQL